jgi:hypothetical protein
MIIAISDSGKARSAPTAPHIHVQKMIATKTRNGLISKRWPRMAGTSRFSMAR